MSANEVRCPHYRLADWINETREIAGEIYVTGGNYWHNEEERCTASEDSRDWECIDAREDLASCQGEVFPRSSLTGVTTTERCEHHYAQYVERTQPRLDEINRRYPERAPADFDPTYAGERWDEED